MMRWIYHILNKKTQYDIELRLFDDQVFLDEDNPLDTIDYMFIEV